MLITNKELEIIKNRLEEALNNCETIFAFNNEQELRLQHVNNEGFLVYAKLKNESKYDLLGEAPKDNIEDLAMSIHMHDYKFKNDMIKIKMLEDFLEFKKDREYIARVEYDNQMVYVYDLTGEYIGCAPDFVLFYEHVI